jgi:hypothetical protein
LENLPFKRVISTSRKGSLPSFSSSYSGFRSYNRPNALYTQEELNILKENDSSIVIMKPDKGNGVVILSKNDYNKKMDEILSDTSKFELLNDDTIKLTPKRESQVKTLLRASACKNRESQVK